MARNLALWIGLFFLLSTILVVSWVSWLGRREGLKSFEHLAVSNAAFVRDLSYPRSPQLAHQLSRILGMGVGFFLQDQPIGNIPPFLASEIREMAASAPAAWRSGDREISVAPLDSENRQFLVLIRSASFRALPRGALFFPALGLALGCASLAFALGTDIVRPLQLLTQWLPALENSEPGNNRPVPAAILKRRDEIGQLARGLAETRSALQREKELRLQSERLSALGRIATSLAHEVKNPAAAIRMHADLLSQNARNGERESLDLIKEEVDQIASLVNQWLFVAKAEPSQTKEHDLNEIAASVSRRLRSRAAHSGVEISLRLCPAALWVDVDRRRIEQAVLNLLHNAIQAMPEGGMVTLSTLRDPSGNCVLEVADQGPGFSIEALRRFGEPFFSEKEGGMGIGLTLSREVTEAHGGSLRAWNHETGRGAVVTLTLPFSKSDHNG